MFQLCLLLKRSDGIGHAAPHHVRGVGLRECSFRTWMRRPYVRMNFVRMPTPRKCLTSQARIGSVLYYEQRTNVSPDAINVPHHDDHLLPSHFHCSPFHRALLLTWILQLLHRQLSTDGRLIILDSHRANGPGPDSLTTLSPSSASQQCHALLWIKHQQKSRLSARVGTFWLSGSFFRGSVSRCLASSRSK